MPNNAAVDAASISTLNFFADWGRTGYVGDLTFVSVVQLDGGLGLDLLPGTSRTRSRWVNEHPVQHNENGETHLSDVTEVGVSPCHQEVCADSTTNATIPLGDHVCSCSPGLGGADCSVRGSTLA